MKAYQLLWCLCIFVLATCNGALQAEASPVVVEKNLFAQDRKPAPPEAAAPTTQANKPGLNPKSVQLDGVFIHGDIKKAVVRFKGQAPGADKGKGSPFLTVREGEKIGDFQVMKIEPKSISLEKDGQTVVVNLFMEGKVAPPPPPVPSTPGMQPSQGGQGVPPQDLVSPGGVPRVPRAQRPNAPGGAAASRPVGNPQGGQGVDGNIPDENLTEEELAAEEAAALEEAGQ